MSLTKSDWQFEQGSENSRLSAAAPFSAYPSAAEKPVVYESLQDLLAVLSSYRWTIVAVASGVFLAVLLVCLIITPRYASKALIEVNRDAAENAGAPGSSQITTQVDDVQTEVATDTSILQNSTLALAVIQKLDLVNHSPFKEAVASGDRGRSLNDAPKSRDKLAKLFEKSLKVESLPDTRLIQITFRNQDPTVASNVVNTLSDLFIDDSLRRRIDSTSGVSYWISKELDGLRKQVEASEQALANYEHKTGLAGIDMANDQSGNGLAMQAHNSVLDRLTALNQELTTAEASRISSEAVYRLIQTQDPEVVLGLGGMSISSGGTVFGQGGGLDLLRSLRAQQIPLKTEYADLATKYGAKNPRLIELHNQVDTLETEIKSELQRISKRAENDYLYARNNEQAILTQLKAQQAVADKLTDDSVQLQVYAQDAFSNRKLYETLLSQLHQANLAAGIRATHLSVVERGRVTGVPVMPNYMIALPLAALGGLLLGITSAFIRRSLDHSISVPDEVEEAVQLPVVAHVPLFENSKSASIVSPGSSLLVDAPESPFSEAFRSLRTALVFSAPQRLGKALLITSPVSCDGKSTIAYNLAVAFAQDNGRVLLIDGDMRNAELHRLFGVSNERGLSQALASQAKTLQGLTFQHGKFENLHLLPGGSKPLLPIELFSTTAFDRLLVEARSSYDWILIDSPPFLPFADAAVLSSKVDAILPVLRSGVTSKQMLMTTTGVLRRMRAPVVGLVLNGVKDRLMAPYYSYPYGKKQEKLQYAEV
jgi:capsular exopolysaccharide synthesis family protein